MAWYQSTNQIAGTMSRDLAEKLIDQSKGLERHMFPRVRVGCTVISTGAKCIELEKRKMQSHFLFSRKYCNVSLHIWLVDAQVWRNCTDGLHESHYFFYIYVDIYKYMLRIWSYFFRWLIVMRLSCSTHFFTYINSEFRIVENI